MLYAGAILVAVLSLTVEFTLAGAQRMATPVGLRPSKAVQKEEPLGTPLDTAGVAV